MLLSILFKSSSYLKNQAFLNVFCVTVEVEDLTIAKVSHVGETKQADGSYKPEHVYEVTCLKEGITEVSFIIGNSKSELNT